jgi:hypothetical protein
MPSTIDPTHPAAGIAVSKAASRANWAAAKAEIEELQTAVAAIDGGGAGVSVLAYGADPTGAANSTSAIQQAINAVGAAGGGIVYLPHGTYKVIPPVDPATTPGVLQPALTVNHDNVTLRGDGMTASILKFRGFGDVDPLTMGDGPRGVGIYATGTRKRLGFERFQLDGGADSGGNDDHSHQAISFNVNVAHEDISLERVWLRRWRGENMYYGGGLAGPFHVTRCRITESRHNAFNLNGHDIYITYCEVDDVLSISEDMAHGKIVYAFNDFRGARTTGLVLIRLQGAGHPEYDLTNYVIVGNTFRGGNGSIRISAGNVFCAHNHIVDVFEGIQVMEPGSYPGDPDNPRLDNILIEGNQIKREVGTGPYGYAMLLRAHAGHPITGLTVRNNVISSRDPAAVRFDDGIVYDFEDAGSRAALIEHNAISGCRRPLRYTGTWPGGVGKVPVIRGNDLRDNTEQVDGDTPPAAIYGGEPTEAQVLLPPCCAIQPTAAFAEPTPDLTKYMKGTVVKITCGATNAPAYVRTGSHFRVPRDRFIYPDTFLTVEFDGTRLREVAWEDRRAAAVTTQTSGTTLDAQGREFVTVNYAVPTTITAHQGFPEHVPVTLVTTNSNVTLDHGPNFSLAGAADVDLTVAGGPYLFVRIGGVLWQMARTVTP